jgi:hypothetical protein
MNILFHSSQIGERGTEVALYDYAFWNIKILANKSYIAVPSDSIHNEERFKQFSDEFEVFLYQTKRELINFINNKKIDLFYTIQSGERTSIIDDIPVKTFVHCVFSLKEPHGTYYIPIHEFLNKRWNTHYPVLPHIVIKQNSTTASMRSCLGIPEDSLVFGCYGGKGSFDIPFARKAVEYIARKNPSIYFLFMNIIPFCVDKYLCNIIFLPASTNSMVKEQFINTCDAMLHARSDGETFGLAIAEFSVKNKPVLTYKPPLWKQPELYIRQILGRSLYQTAHLMNLGEKAIIYSGFKSLIKKIECFPKYYDKTKNYDVFSDTFSPENVMKKFNDIITGKKNSA